LTPLLRKVRWSTTVKRGLRVNGGIRADKVRLVDDANNQVGVVSRDEALSRAQEASMDLVEVAPNSDPPVCRIMDYGKWLYQQKRRVREAHKKTQHPVATLKESCRRPAADNVVLSEREKGGNGCFVSADEASRGNLAVRIFYPGIDLAGRGGYTTPFYPDRVKEINRLR
jgi:hypothetical protein